MVMISIDEINKLQAQNKGLIEQNRQLQQVCKTLAEGLNKRQEMLQEIKSIVSNIIDGYIRPYGDYEQLKKILDLITKAEEE